VSDEFRFSPRPNRAREILWRPWGDAVFREAQQKGRPILLSISAVWCHWCHVMDETTYSDRRVIEQVNARFIPVRVDNDRRPDVNRRYNMGGWPSTVFLTETGDIVTGATYVPADDLLGVLQRIDEIYTGNRGELVQKGTEQRAAALSQLREAMKAEESRRATQKADDGAEAGDVAAANREETADVTAPEGVVTPPRSPLVDTPAPEHEEAVWGRPLMDGVLSGALRAFDPVDGGFGYQPKFPQADVLSFLLLRASGCADPQLDETLTRTLDRMADGGLYDRAEDGFFRYATKTDWSEPHYEKMLEDNAKLARVYLDAAVIYASERQPGSLLAPGNAAGANDEAADADAAAEPSDAAATGAAAPAGEAEPAADAADEPAESSADAASSDAAAEHGPDPDRAAHYRDVAAGVLRYLDAVLWLPDASAYAGSQDADEEYYALDLDARRERSAPFVDETVYVDWNALAARALLRGAVVLGRPELAGRALTTLDALWEGCHGRRGMWHFAGQPEESGAIDGLLSDQAAMAAALLDAYEVAGDRLYLARAEILSDWVDEHLTAPGGGLFDRARGLETSGLLSVPMVSLDEAAMMADVWMRLAAYTGEGRYRIRASRLLASLRHLAAKMGMMAAPLGSALLRALEPQVHVVVTGPREDPVTRSLQAAALGVAASQRTLQILDPHTDAERMVRDGFALDAPPRAYVCVGSACLAPTADPEEIARLARGRGAEAQR